MSHLSRHRNKLIAGAVIAASGGIASASPLVNVFMTGKDITQGQAAFTTAPIQVQTGDTIVYQVLTFLAPTGTTNALLGATPYSIKVNNQDGINSLSVNAFELTSQQIQVDFKNAVPQQVIVKSSSGSPTSTTTVPGEGIVLLTATVNWKSGTGANGGHLGARGNGNNDIVFIRPVAPAGTFRGLTSTQAASVIGTGLFVVTGLGDGSASTVGLKYTPSTQGGGAGAFTVNNHTTILQWSDTTENGADPIEAFNSLTLTTIPEPGTLSMLGLAAAGLLVRRKEKKA